MSATHLTGQIPHYTQLFIDECPGTFDATRSTDPQVTIRGNIPVAGTTGQIWSDNAFGRWHAVFWTHNNWTYMVASIGQDASLPDEALLTVANQMA